jgi:hypothetical protein
MEEPPPTFFLLGTGMSGAALRLCGSWTQFRGLAGNAPFQLGLVGRYCPGGNDMRESGMTAFKCSRRFCLSSHHGCTARDA